MAVVLDSMVLGFAFLDIGFEYVKVTVITRDLSCSKESELSRYMSGV